MQLFDTRTAAVVSRLLLIHTILFIYRRVTCVLAGGEKNKRLSKKNGACEGWT